MGERISAVVMVVVLVALVGCTRDADVDTAAPDGDAAGAPATTCAAIADEAVAMINDYLETAGPTVRDAPPPPEALDEPLERRFTAAGCTRQEFGELMGERLGQIKGAGEPADRIREAIIFAADSDVERGP